MFDQLNASLDLIISQTKENASNLAIILLIPWVLFFINNILGKRLFILGIIPRRWYGLPGILFAPVLHANFNHIFFNSFPLLVLSDFLLINGLAYFIFVPLLSPY